MPPISALARFKFQRAAGIAANYAAVLRSFNRDVWLYLLVSALFGYAIFGGIYLTLLNLYLLRLGYGPEFAGLVNGMGQVAFGLCALPVGLLGQKTGTRPLLIAGLALMVLGFGLLPLAEFSPLSVPAWLIGTQVVGQIGVAIYFVNGAPFVAGVTTPAERNHVYAASLALVPLAGFAGSLTGGLLPVFFAHRIGAPLSNPAPYRNALLLAAALMLVAVIAMLATRKQTRAPASVTASPHNPAPVAMMTILFFTVLLRVVGEGALRTFFNIYLDEVLAMPVVKIGMLLAAGQLLAVPASMAMPLFAARWGIAPTYIGSTLAIAVSFVPLALLPYGLTVAAGYMGTAIFLSIARPAIVALQMNAVSAHWRTIMGGATTTAVGLGWAIASLSGSLLVARWGYISLFLSSAAITAISTTVFWWYFRLKPTVIYD